MTARSTRAEFIVMDVIIGAGWWDCMPRNLSLSITSHIDKDITRYQYGGGRCYISSMKIMYDMLLEFQVRSWDLWVRERPQSGKDIGKVKISEW